MLRTAVTLTALATVTAAFAALSQPAATAVQEACPMPGEPMRFASDYVDLERAGGEPIVTTHPDGGLLWGSHAGTTHFYSPAANDVHTSSFAAHYEGQTYQYRSDDGGVSWDFVPRTPISSLDPASGLPNSGFSDPEFAIDKAGNVFISEINLANIAISRSSDGGRSYRLQSLAEITMSDRQWMEADEEDVLWFVANTFGGGSSSSGNAVTGSLDHHLYKSVDGGATFSAPQRLGRQQSSDIEIDRSDGRLYELHSQGDRLTLWIAPEARSQTPPKVGFLNLDGTVSAPRPSAPPVVADRYDRMSSIGPTLDIDPHGNLYVVWDDAGGKGREAGIYLTMSSDRGLTWTEAVRVNQGRDTAFWPWVAAGEHGAVAVWLQHEGAAPDNDPERAEGDWYVMATQVQRCDDEQAGSVFSAPTAPVRASAERVHTGTICTGGTICQAFAIDRRLGDYFANAIDRDGNVYISVSDTRQGGAVALPLVIRQVDGPTVGDPYANAGIWGGAVGYDEGTPDDGDDDRSGDHHTGGDGCAGGFRGLLLTLTRWLGGSATC